MRAWTFLRGDSRDASWPRVSGSAPGAWRLPDEGAPGVTVAVREDLAWWIAEELWEVEVAGPRVAAGNAVFVRAARLVRRVDRWGPDVWEPFVIRCKHVALRAVSGSRWAEATTDLAARAQRVGARSAALAGYVTALACASSAGERDTDGHRARFAAERAAQSGWIARALDL
ncbi:MAG: hypothetical protein IT379_22055 [Deltaproteobacteria bacterium]|nr:hypothetical protein [Deltaproteobacteria bacterium]